MAPVPYISGGTAAFYTVRISVFELISYRRVFAFFVLQASKESVIECC